MDARKLAELSGLLKDLSRAILASEKAASVVAECPTPRRGPRGGKRTTLEANWAVAAERRERIWKEARELAKDALNL